MYSSGGAVMRACTTEKNQQHNSKPGSYGLALRLLSLLAAFWLGFGWQTWMESSRHTLTKSPSSESLSWPTTKPLPSWRQSSDGPRKIVPTWKTASERSAVSFQNPVEN